MKQWAERINQYENCSRLTKLSFKLKHTFFKFTQPKQKEHNLVCVRINFSNNNIHFYNAKGAEVPTQPLPGFVGFGASFKGRSHH